MDKQHLRKYLCEHENQIPFGKNGKLKRCVECNKISWSVKPKPLSSKSAGTIIIDIYKSEDKKVEGYHSGLF